MGDGPFLRDGIETLSLWSNTGGSLGAATMSTIYCRGTQVQQSVNYCPGTWTRPGHGPGLGMDHARAWTRPGHGPDQVMDQTRAWTKPGHGPGQGMGQARSWTRPGHGPGLGMDQTRACSKPGYG